MAEFPTYEKNKPRASEPITVTAPGDPDPNDTRPPQERLVDQQWREVIRLRLHQEHPLSVNRDATGRTA